MSAEPLRKCPACKKARLERQIGAGAGVIFKGSGFYQTDYKKSGNGAADKGEGTAKKSEGSGKDGAATESALR